MSKPCVVCYDAWLIILSCICKARHDFARVDIIAVNTLNKITVLCRQTIFILHDKV